MGGHITKERVGGRAGEGRSIRRGGEQKEKQITACAVASPQQL